jgi:hypothetical protein
MPLAFVYHSILASNQELAPFNAQIHIFLRLAYIFLNFRCKLVFGKQILSVSTNPTKSIEQDNLGSSANSLTSSLNEQISTFLETGSEKPPLTEYNYFLALPTRFSGFAFGRV